MTEESPEEATQDEDVYRFTPIDGNPTEYVLDRTESSTLVNITLDSGDDGSQEILVFEDDERGMWSVTRPYGERDKLQVCDTQTPEYETG